MVSQLEDEDRPSLANACHFPLVQLHGSGLLNTDDSFDGAPSPITAARALNLFCSCKSSGGAGAFLLVKEGAANSQEEKRGKEEVSM